MTMTPLKLSILVHYVGSPIQFRNGDFSAPAVREALSEFAQSEMLQRHQTVASLDPKFSITEKGRFYVEHLLTIPFPVSNWRIPR